MLRPQRFVRQGKCVAKSKAHGGSIDPELCPPSLLGCQVPVAPLPRAGCTAHLTVADPQQVQATKDSRGRPTRPEDPSLGALPPKELSQRPAEAFYIGIISLEDGLSLGTASHGEDVRRSEKLHLIGAFAGVAEHLPFVGEGDIEPSEIGVCFEKLGKLFDPLQLIEFVRSIDPLTLKERTEVAWRKRMRHRSADKSVGITCHLPILRYPSLCAPWPAGS